MRSTEISQNFEKYTKRLSFSCGANALYWIFMEISKNQLKNNTMTQKTGKIKSVANALHRNSQNIFKKP